MANIVLDFLHNYQTGERRETEPANAYQYDEGHVLEAVLPEVITSAEIHYWIRGMEEADAYTPTSITPNEDDSCTVLGNIPNSYFETNGELRIYIVVTDGTASITTYEGKLHICQRSMPDDYVDDDPENEAVRVITEARAAAATATEKAGEAAASADQAQEILDSIPEDYSQLSEDVSDLKDDYDHNTEAVFKPVFGANLLHLNKMVDNAYYYESEQANNSFCYFVVPVESGKTYRYDYVRFGSTQTTAKINTSEYGLPVAGVYTADYTGDFYVSVGKSSLNNAFFCENKDYDLISPAKYSIPEYGKETLAQGYGISHDIPLSQYGLSKLFPVLDGTDLCFTGKKVEGKYAYSAGNSVAFGSSSTYFYYVIPASEGHYKFSEMARWVVASDKQGNVLAYLGGSGDVNTDVDCPEGTEYLWVTFYSRDSEIAKIGRGNSIPTETKLSASALKTEGSRIADRLYGKGYYKQTGTLGDGQVWETPSMNVKKNQVYSFLAKVSTFGSIKIGHGVSAYESAYLVINGTNVTLHQVFSSDTTSVYPHGLTIAEYIYIQIVVGVGVATLKLYSNGNSFTQADIPWGGDSNAGSFVSNTGSTLSDCTFTWSCADFRKSVWMFGNSYFGMTNAERWVSYLINAGYGDNVLLNAYPGESSNAALTSLNNMIGKFGVPKTLIWCLGMNDGSDANSDTPSTTWSNAIRNLKGVCELYGVELILATIPTVPSINHNGKNAYVKASGYRYIDFASAVGADGSGSWYTGMLSSDGVHPTEKGAKALYYQAIADVPEITYGNP